MMPLAGSRALLPASHQLYWEKVGSVPASISIYLFLVNSPLSLLPPFISLPHHKPFHLLLSSWSFTVKFIHSFRRYFLSSYSGPNTVLNCLGYTSVNRINIPVLWELI